jgi:nucleotide-binding universal stress UspA family protein
MLKLLIAVDGSDHSRRAVEAAARLAKETTALEAVLLNVREGQEYFGELQPFDHESIVRALRDRQQELLEAALAHARLSGLESLRTLATAGAAAQEIARAATDLGVDQIVMGTRGMNALGGLLLGSVAQRVVHLATMPVLLVK